MYKFLPIRIEIIENINDLSKYAHDWNALAEESIQQLPMLSYAWVSSHFEFMLEQEEKWVCLFAFDGKELVGVFPVIIECKSIIGIRFLRLHAPFNEHTKSGDIIIRKGYERDVLIALFNSIIDNYSNCIYIKMDCVTIESYYDAINDVSDVCNIYIKHKLIGYGAYINTKSPIEQYKGTINPKFLTNLRRVCNKLSRTNGYEYKVINGKNASEKEFMSFLQLEASGWKGKEGTAILQDPKLVSFYSALVKRLSDCGWLEWHFLFTGGNVIAGKLAVHMGTKKSLIKIAYDENYSSYAPGNILFYNTVESGFQDHSIDEVNLITNPPWSANWQVQTRKYFSNYIFTKGIRSILFGLAPYMIRNAGKNIPGMRTIYSYSHQIALKILTVIKKGVLHDYNEYRRDS